MSLRGVEIKEGKVGSSISAGREFGLIGGGVAVAGKIALAEVHTLRRPSDAVAIGIDAIYDTTNDVRVYRHIEEFYRIAGEGKKLHICLVDKTTVPVDMVTTAKKLVLEAEGNISDLVFMFNPAANYIETLVDGLNSDVKTAIPALQSFATWCDEHDMPLHTILEGRAISDNLAVLADLRDLKVGEVALFAEKVTLVVGQDWTYAETLSPIGKKFADVGNYLGVIASRPWNCNPGEVATNNLSDAEISAFVVGGLSNHKKYSEVYESLQTMDDKGYVFPMKYTGTSGYWWNDGHVCAPIVMNVQTKKMNQHTIYYSHTIDMSKRALRIAFLPEVKKVFELEKGKLPTGTVGYFNAIGDQAFGALGNLISEGSTDTDPNSDLLIVKELNVAFGVAPTGCINVIKGTINLKTN